MAAMKLAIVGGGPSAFYVASRLLSLSGNLGQLRIHMFDRLWAPHGLVRYGVAPDHPEVKNCTHKFDTAAADSRFRFFGNVNLGGPSSSIPSATPLPLQSLFRNYTHVVFATGCTEPTLHPSLAPSSYCVPALSLVHWYTQHPSRPPPPPLQDLSHVSIIGNGNVSLDIARILLAPVSLLAQYDVPAPVLNVLARSQVNHVSIIARRGPLEAAFTTKELRELINLPNTSMLPLPHHLLSVPPSLTRQQSRVLQLLQKGSPRPPPASPSTSHKTWSLEFFRSPIHLTLPPPTPTPPSPRPLADLTLAHTTLDPTHARAIPTSARTVLPTSLVVTSLGFHAASSLPFYDPTLRHLRTDPAGRVLPPGAPAPVKNVYASGWTATGAHGVLAATMMNAYALADTILSDWLPEAKETGEDLHTVPPEQGGFGDMPSSVGSCESGGVGMAANPNAHPTDPPAEVVEGLRKGQVTTYEDWKAVDAEEVRRGEELGKERERMGWEEARAFLAGGR